MKKTLFLLFWLSSMLAYSGQALKFDKIKFNYLTSTNGLTNNYVSDILEDNKGFLWFATSDGLNKWDGNSMQTFKFDPENENSLSSNFILTIAEDFSGNLWIGTNQRGVVRYSYQEEKFYRYSSNLNDLSKIQSTYIRDLRVDNNGTVWVGTDLGLCKYLPESDSFKRIKFNPNSNVEIINNIHTISSSKLLFQTDQGLFSYNLENSNFSPYLIEGVEIPDLLFAPLCFTKSNHIWIGSQLGLYKYNITNQEYKKYTQAEVKEITSHNFSWINEDSESNIWIGTHNAGVTVFQPNANKFAQYKAGILDGNYLSDNIITCIYEDSHANVWIASKEGGLSYFNKKDNIFQYFEFHPTKPNHLLNPKISSFAEDVEGLIWFGTGDGGLHKFDPITQKIKPYIFQNNTISPSILDLLDADSYLYLCGWSTGLVRFNKTTEKFEEVVGKQGTYPLKSPLNIKGMGKDADGNIWLAVHNRDGLYVYNPINNQFYNSLNPGNYNQELLNVPYAVDVKLDSKKRIWIASYSGLHMYDGEFHSYRVNNLDSHSISSSYIYEIGEGNDSTIWIGSTMGLDRLKETKNGFQFESLTNRYGLPENVKGIQTDNTGNIWLSSNSGLTKFNPINNESQHYFLNKNIEGQEFSERSFFKSSTGDFYLGSNYGFYKFSPDSLTETATTPNIYITDFKIFNESLKPNQLNSPLEKSILQTQKITLSHNQSAISFEYVSINFNKMVNIDYAYQLEGFDNKWNKVGNQRFANYTNLEPGTYTFRVKAIIGNNLSLAPEANIEIEITPPFWATTFAYIFYVIVGLLTLFLVQLGIINRINLKNQLRLEKVKIENANETNLMKLRFFTNISHEFRTPLTLIQAPIEKLLNKNASINDEERVYQYKMIQNSTSKMLRLINQLMDYRKFEAGSLVLEPSLGDFVGFCRKTWDNFKYLAQQKQINYQFDSNIGSFFTAFDSDKLDKVISNLLSNAFKNTPSKGTILLKIEVENESKFEGILSISVKDSGRGISEKDLPFIFDRFYMVSNAEFNANHGTGIGLTLSKELVELHQGSILVNSELGVGSEFIVKLPFKHEESNGKDFPTKKIETPDEAINSTNTKRSNILIVEDDETLLDFLKHELEQIYHVHTAINGSIGIEIAKSVSPNLIISDIMMPVMDGIELCEKIKKDAQTSHIPVILLTARHSQNKELEGIQSGADAYVQKPFNLELLMSRISNLLNSRKELFEKFDKETSLSFHNDKIESRDQKLIQEIIDLILQNISNDKINATFIADNLHMSRSLVYIKVEALTGKTVNEFIRNIRLKRSIEYLKSSDLSITEIAYSVGFSSQSYFSRSFVKQYGYSPKKFQDKLNR